MCSPTSESFWDSPSRAMQEVAPPGFQIHYDFTHQGDLGPQSRGITDHMPQALKKRWSMPIPARR